MLWQTNYLRNVPEGFPEIEGPQPAEPGTSDSLLVTLLPGRIAVDCFFVDTEPPEGLIELLFDLSAS